MCEVSSKLLKNATVSAFLTPFFWSCYNKAALKISRYNLFSNFEVRDIL